MQRPFAYSGDLQLERTEVRRAVGLGETEGKDFYKTRPVENDKVQEAALEAWDPQETLKREGPVR